MKLIETLKTREYKYIHLNQNGPKFDFIREKYDKYYEGCCWYACLVMAADVLSLKKNNDDIITDLFNKLSSLTSEVKKEIISEIPKHKDDFNQTAFDFIIQNSLIKINGNTGADFISKYHKEFVCFVNRLFKFIKTPLAIEIFKDPFRMNYDEFIDMLSYKISILFIPVIGFNMIIDNEKKVTHMVMLGGINNKGMIFSDPNMDNPITIKHSDIMRLIENKEIEYHNKRKILYDDKFIIIFVRRKKRIKMKLLD